MNFTEAFVECVRGLFQLPSARCWGFKECVGRLLQRPLNYYRSLKRMDLFMIGNVPAERVPVGLRFKLDKYVGLGEAGEFWAFDVRGLVLSTRPANVQEAVRELSCIILEEVCHYLGWLHSVGAEPKEGEFLREIVEAYED